MIDTIDYFNTEKLDVGGNISHHATENYFVDSQEDTYVDATCKNLSCLSIKNITLEQI